MLAILLLVGAAEPVPVYKVENKVPTAFVVVNKMAAKPAAAPAVVAAPFTPAGTPTPARPADASSSASPAVYRTGSTRICVGTTDDVVSLTLVA